MPGRFTAKLTLAVCLALLPSLSACRQSLRPRNLVLITVDTLRADHLGCYGNRLGLTPTLDRFATDAERFTAAFAAAPSTLPSLSALMTGRYPEELGILNNVGILPGGVATLATSLRARGWRTGAVVSNFVLRPESGMDAGFDVYDATFPQQEGHRPMPERIAADTATAALRVLDTLGTGPRQAIFLWVHFQDPHGPYTPPGDRRGRYLPAERAAPDGTRTLAEGTDEHGFRAIPRYQFADGEYEVAYYRAGYDGEVAYMDEQLGRLLGGVRERLPAADTAVVLTADHGEGLGEGDYWFAHGEYLTDPLVRVPLLVRVPGRTAVRRDDVVSLADLFGTLAHLLTGETAAGARGRDILSPGAPREAGRAYLATLGEATTARFGLVEGGYKYVVSSTPHGPEEELAQIDGHGAAAAPSGDHSVEMRTALETFQRSLHPVAGAAAQPLSAEDRAKLRALGYVRE